MSKSKVNNTNSFNIDIEELKGIRVTINGEESKYLVVYPNDVSFIEDLISYSEYLNEVSHKYKNLSDEIENIGESEDEEENKEKINKTLKVFNEIIEESKDKFNKMFKDETAFDRIFDKVKNLETVVLVIERILNFSLNERKDKVNSTSKYTDRYKK
jgi:hypothetical protein